MKFNQVTLLAAAALLIPMGGTIASLTAHQSTAIAQTSFESTVLAQDAAPSERRFAKHHRGGHGKKGERKLKHLQEIGVDEARLAQIKEIMEACRAEAEKLHPEAQEARQKMHELYASNASDEELRDQFEDMKELRMKLKDNRFECKLKIRSLLTEEERQKLIEHRQQRWERRGHRRGHRGHR